MAYTYDPGITTPGYAGLIEVAGTSPIIRLNSALLDPVTTPTGGTFKLEDNPFLSSAPVRAQVTDYAASDGGLLGPVYLGSWPLTIGGWIYVTTPDDTGPAEEQLKAAFAAKLGVLTLTLNHRNWTTKRQVSAQTSGQIVFSPRHSVLRIPTRNFQIPMVAADPLLYDADNLKAITLPATVATAVTNNGSRPAPFTARFSGAFSSATLTRSDGLTIVVDSTRLATTIAAGQYVDVTCGNGRVTAVRSDGTNAYAALTASRATRVLTGTHNWTMTCAGTITYRDTWG